MEKRIIIGLLLVFLPIMVFAQSVGGEIRRPVKKQQVTKSRPKRKKESKEYAASDAIEKSRNGVISQLVKIKEMNEDAKRKQLRSAVVEQLKTISIKDPDNKATYDEVIEKLGNRVACENSDQSRGHYNALITKLQSLNKKNKTTNKKNKTFVI